MGWTSRTGSQPNPDHRLADPPGDPGDHEGVVHVARGHSGLLQLQLDLQDWPRHPEDVGQYSEQSPQQRHVASEIPSGEEIELNS